MSIGGTAFQLAFEISPIILTGGLAQNVPGGMLPIVSLTEAANFVTGLLSGGDAFNLDNFFAHFVPTAGATLIDQVIGEYPFANQGVAGNAVITKPLMVSLRMICPANARGGYISKLATMIALQSAIAQHNVSGGTYTVVTPAALWTDLVMLGLRDVSANSSAQAQTEWQWDFRKPLLTQAQADQAQNNLMSKISGGTAVQADGSGGVSWSGIAQTVGTPPSLAAPGVIPAASSLLGAQTASPGGVPGAPGGG